MGQKLHTHSLTRNVCGEDVLVEDDEVLDELVDEVLELDLVPLLGDRHQGRAEADRQVVRVHHVLVAAKSFIDVFCIPFSWFFPVTYTVRRPVICKVLKIRIWGVPALLGQ